jgi:hypothetical protein
VLLVALNTCADSARSDRIDTLRRDVAEQAQRIEALQRAAAANGPAIAARQNLQATEIAACEKRTMHLRATLIHLSKMAGLTRLPRPLGAGTWPPWPAETAYRWDPDGFIRQTLAAAGDR